MTTLQKIVLGTVLVAVIASGIFQLDQASQLHGQIQNLRLQQASLNEQIQQLKSDREISTHRAGRAETQLENPPPDGSKATRQSSTNTPAARPAVFSPTLERDLSQALAEPSAGRREIALKKLGQSISPDDVPRALAILAKTLGMDGVQSPLFGELASKWGNSNPTAAAAWADSLSNDEARKAAMVGVMKGWAGKAPEAAASYAAALSPPDLQEAAFMKVIGEWSFWGGADGAANWVAQLPAGSLRDKAMGPIVFWGTGQCPATIADMLDATGNPDIIRQYGEQVANVWLNRDPPAARVWIEKSPLPDDVKNRLLKPKE